MTDGEVRALATQAVSENPELWRTVADGKTGLGWFVGAVMARAARLGKSVDPGRVGAELVQLAAERWGL